MTDLSALTHGTVELSKQVGEFIRRECEHFDKSRIEQKEGFNNLVSYVDKEAERRLVAGLTQLLPEAGFITEEGTVTQTTDQEWRWIIDPLDGTTNFLHALPVFATSVALARGNEVMLGVVYEVNRQECFYAQQGRAAYCNDRKIAVSAAGQLNQSLLATGFPYYHFEKREPYLNIIKQFLESTHGVRRLGSAAVDLAYVACGRFEGFFEYNLHPWDVAAGAFIVQQAGGIVTDFSGGNNFLFGGELCAGSLHIHHPMLRVIQQHWY